MLKLILVICCTIVAIVSGSPAIVRSSGFTEEEIEAELDKYNTEAIGYCNKNGLASWDVQTDVGNDEKVKEYQKISLEYATFRKKKWEEIWSTVDSDEYVNPKIKRQLKDLKQLGTAALQNEDFQKLSETTNSMSAVYNLATICPYKKPNCADNERLTLDPEIEEILSTSTDYDELAYVWKAWRDATGKHMRDDYQTYVNLMNKAAGLNGFSDAGEWWRDRYEDPNFIESVDNLWDTIKPLYNELHTYVRFKLFEIYGNKMDYSSENIPAHLLGNMWAQSWEYLYEKTKPFKESSVVDISKKLEEIGIKGMFEKSNEFYLSMGLENNDMSYGPKALIEKPNNRNVTCHASAWDFCDGEDFRIKMCTNKNKKDFVTIHHEMGHIQYYLQYKQLPLALRGGANPGFHEALGDTIALSVDTPKHLKEIDFIDEYADSEADNINALYSMALERLAFLPFGLLIDKWRWEVFSGKITTEKWNDRWWELRELYQKVSSPVSRSDDDFDPGAKYHVPANSQYIAYFIAHVLEFQMYRALCIEAKQFDPENPTKNPLHKCDFYKSTEAGLKLKAGLSLGASEKWPLALEAITGTQILSSDALIEYFKPLEDHLKILNQKLAKEHKMRQILETYNKEAVVEYNALVTAEWDVQTHVNEEEFEENHLAAVEKYAKFVKEQYELHFKNSKPEDYQDSQIARQIQFLTKLGTDKLDAENLKELTATVNKMQSTYSSAKICPFKKQSCDLETEGLTLDPDIEKILSTSHDYDELAYVWQQWHEKSGKLMRNDYATYVGLMNKAAELNEYTDAGDMWRADYEDPNFIESVDNLWDTIKPLYNELHTYVRFKLFEIYGNKMDYSSENIPAYLLGNMWAQSWEYLYEKTKPFKESSVVDISKKLEEIGIKGMFEKSNEFYLSMGLENNDMSYGPKAIIEKPNDRIVTCHASAWDFGDGEDFRIKMCTNKNKKDFVTIHHEMGHIQYYLQYKQLPLALRGGANPGFHEALGDTIALSVDTPKHLKEIDFIDEYADSEADNINALYSMALERLAFLPFGLLIDKWRWEVFSGKITKEKWNERWWDLRELYQKVNSPVPRSDDDFDPGAKYHVPANSQYIAYFIAHVLEFQMYRALCIEAKQFDPENPTKNPLHKCDFYKSTEAGLKLKAGLSLGASEKWPLALEAITGTQILSSDALIEYFKPLEDHLKILNQKLAKEHEMRITLKTYNDAASIEHNALVTAEWDVQTHVNEKEFEENHLAAVEKYAQFAKDQYELHFKNSKPEDYQDSRIARQIRFLTKLGTDKLDAEKLKELTATVNKMQSTYSSAKICPFKKQSCDLETEGLPLDPDIEGIMSTNHDYDELTYVWQQWHEKSGKLMRSNYSTYVELMNEAAELNGYADAGDMWRADYEDPNFAANMDDLWSDIEPLYKELHTYVRHRLAEFYKGKFDPKNPYIPAHILGNMWAQQWDNVFELVKPYPNASDIDVTPKMIEQGYTALRMFELSDKFYTDLGLESNAMSYGNKSIIEKPTDRDIVCHASAWDFSDGEDYRIKQCTIVNLKNLETVHHEMGHIQYFILYKGEPLPFRNGANPGFHEAVGDLIALSVTTPNHLKKINLLEDYADSDADNINALLKMAMQRLAFIPFGLLIDKYRWDIFSGVVPKDKWNSHWEDLRKKYQMVESPVSRDETDFDAGGKYHVGANSQYMNYFFAHVLEFQLHKAMCIAAGQYDPNNPNSKPLHKCDIDGSIVAGEKLRKGLTLGMSKHWKEVLQEITGENELKADAIKEYFKPLSDFLKTENVRMTLETYNHDVSLECQLLQNADWDAKTDVNNPEKQDNYMKAVARYATFVKEQFKQHFEGLNPEELSDESVRRQVTFLSKLGTDILNTDKLNDLTKSINNMESIYNNAKVCPYDEQSCNIDTDGMTLEKGITERMASSGNYDELKYIWEHWHNNSGKHMRNDYSNYVKLMNEAASANGFKDAGEMWRFDYEDDNFIVKMDNLWNKIKPLYTELHTYVHRQLRKLYRELDVNDELIPAHILGNMWAQSWVNLYERIKPFEHASDIDVTSKMIEQKYTPLKMFETSDEFYMGLGLPTNNMSYTGDSIIEKPEDRLIVCHASAWDFCDGKDFRIKQCTLVNMNDFETAHHEMGHIQYYIQYKDQPEPFRHGANPGFHEAIGDLMALSFSTPAHLKKIELLENYENTKEDNINALFKTALKKVAFLPFGLLIDKYRWDIFQGAVPESKWNGHWEKLREEYQKIKSPVQRSEDNFDAGGKYHVAANSQYINYFFAHILEFQLHKAMCIAANQYNPSKPTEKPLHQCDIDSSNAAGDKLKAGLSLGMSKHWTEALHVMTGENDLTADALLEYFKPLQDFLVEQNKLPEPEEEYDNTIPIVVGSVIGGLLAVGLVGYGIYYFRKRR